MSRRGFCSFLQRVGLEPDFEQLFIILNPCCPNLKPQLAGHPKGHQGQVEYGGYGQTLDSLIRVRRVPGYLNVIPAIRPDSPMTE
jgi:hypothetical protein